MASDFTITYAVVTNHKKLSFYLFLNLFEETEI